MGVQPVPIEPFGSIPLGCIGLVVGRGILTKAGLVVHPGILDNHHPKVSVLCSCPSGVFAINPGDRVAQVIFIPVGVDNGNEEQDTSRPMGSTGTDKAWLIMDLRQRPKLKIDIQGKQFEGILDSGADKSIISSHWWPKAWPVTESSHSLQGLGYADHPVISAQALEWRDSEGRSGRITPYVLPLPVNLWGRDLMQDLGLVLTNEYSPQSQNIMQHMGYVPGQGLGRFSAGRLEPLEPVGNEGRKGLGF